MRPTDATSLGDHRFDHLLDDVSEPARRKWLEHSRAELKDLPKRINYKKLTRAGQIDYEIFADELKRAIWIAENTDAFARDPRVYGGYISDAVYTLLTQSSLPAETNIANAISRMRYIPSVIPAARASIKNPDKTALETAIRQNQGAIGFFETGVVELVGDSPQASRVKAAAEPIVATLKNYQRFLEGLRADAKDNWRLGKDKFAKKLVLTLNAGFTADEVLKEAEAEFTRVEREMYVVSRQLWSKYFPKDVLPADDEAGRRETITRVTKAVSQEHGKPEDLLADTKATVERVKEFIRAKDILRLPEPDRCQIIEMPEFRRGNSIAYLESAPPLDAENPSFYAVSPPPSDWSAERVKSFLEEYNRHMLQILTIHEAYPGHYVQLEYANRNKSLIRKVLGSGVFAEGWAVYTEQTMLDQGYGEQDLALRLNQLKFYLRAVGNAILDHRMHCSNWSDEEALDFLMKRAFQSEGEARLKVIRSKQSSVQLSTYFVGRMAFYRLRQEAQREMGEQFDLGRFHEAALDHGSIPTKFLPELTRARLRQTR